MGCDVRHLSRSFSKPRDKSVPARYTSKKMGSQQSLHSAKVNSTDFLSKKKTYLQRSFFLFRKLDIIGTCEDGNYFYLKATNDSARLSHEVSGHLYHPSGFLYTISQCNLSMDKLGENGPVPRHFSLRFTANRHVYHAIINLMPSQFENFAGRPWHHQSTTYPCHLTLNSRQGRVLFISTETYNGHCPLDVQTSLPFLAQPSRSLTVEETEKLVVLFNEEACRYESLVGGKGASLALLSSNLKSMPIECNVPQGFCVTVHAWKKQIDGNKDVQLKLDELDQVGRGVLQGPLGEHCQEASDLLAAAPVDPFIQDSIRQALHVNIPLRALQCNSAESMLIYECFRNCLGMKLKPSALPSVHQLLEKMEKIFLRPVRMPLFSAAKDSMQSSRVSKNVGPPCCLTSR